MSEVLGADGDGITNISDDHMELDQRKYRPRSWSEYARIRLEATYALGLLCIALAGCADQPDQRNVVTYPAPSSTPSSAVSEFEPTLTPVLTSTPEPTPTPHPLEVISTPNPDSFIDTALYVELVAAATEGRDNLFIPTENFTVEFFENARRGVVQIEFEIGDELRVCSAWISKIEGDILLVNTALHCFENDSGDYINPQEVSIGRPEVGDMFVGTVGEIDGVLDGDTDFVQLRLNLPSGAIDNMGLVALPYAVGYTLEAGEPVLVMGYPGKIFPRDYYNILYASEQIHNPALSELLDGQAMLGTKYGVDGRTVPGQGGSGGPIFNTSGAVIGVTSEVYERDITQGELPGVGVSVLPSMVSK